MIYVYQCTNEQCRGKRETDQAPPDPCVWCGAEMVEIERYGVDSAALLNDKTVLPDRATDSKEATDV